MIGLCFFFFKQKTAYEMRISDWSSDVCSSDLACAASAVRARCAGSCRALRPRLLPFRSAADPWLPLRPPLRIGSACIVAFPHNWQATNDRVIFQVETWFMFNYWMRRALASTRPRTQKGVTGGDGQEAE